MNTYKKGFQGLRYGNLRPSFQRKLDILYAIKTVKKAEGGWFSIVDLRNKTPQTVWASYYFYMNGLINSDHVVEVWKPTAHAHLYRIVGGEGNLDALIEKTKKIIEIEKEKNEDLERIKESAKPKYEKPSVGTNLKPEFPRSNAQKFMDTVSRAYADFIIAEKGKHEAPQVRVPTSLQIRGPKPLRRNQILEIMSDGKAYRTSVIPKEFYKRYGLQSKNSFRSLLSEMTQKGFLIRESRGIYKLSDNPSDKKPLVNCIVNCKICGENAYYTSSQLCRKHYMSEVWMKKPENKKRNRERLRKNYWKKKEGPTAKDISWVDRIFGKKAL